MILAGVLVFLQYLPTCVSGKIRVSGDKSALGGIGRAWRNITTKNSIIPAGDMVEADSEREPVRRTEAAIRSSAANADVAKILAKRVWIQDTERSACHKCNASFHIFLRRHHCRLCGDIFCDACSSFVWEPYGKRVCGSCYFTIIPSIGRAAAGPDNVITTAGKTLHRDGAATDGFKDDLGYVGIRRVCLAWVTVFTKSTQTTMKITLFKCTFRKISHPYGAFESVGASLLQLDRSNTCTCDYNDLPTVYVHMSC